MTSDERTQRPMVEMSTGEQDRQLEEIFRTSAPSLRGRLLAMTRDPAIADDLVGEAFLRLAAEMRAGRAPLDPAAWLHRVGSNLVVSRARHATVATRAMPGLLERDVASSPEDAVIERERDLLVRDALATLRVDDRQIVVMAARGYRPEEIANVIGKTGQATRTRLCRARGRLRARLELAGLAM
jgi:RNA polymerase sigma-70 factor (ECF subfamily)